MTYRDKCLSKARQFFLVALTTLDPCKRDTAYIIAQAWAQEADEQKFKPQQPRLF